MTCLRMASIPTMTTCLLTLIDSKFKLSTQSCGPPGNNAPVLISNSVLAVLEIFLLHRKMEESVIHSFCEWKLSKSAVRKLFWIVSFFSPSLCFKANLWYFEIMTMSGGGRHYCHVDGGWWMAGKIRSSWQPPWRSSERWPHLAARAASTQQSPHPHRSNDAFLLSIKMYSAQRGVPGDGEGCRLRGTCVTSASCQGGGGACSSPGKNNIFKLGLPPSQEKNAGGLELAVHLEK